MNQAFRLPRNQQEISYRHSVIASKNLYPIDRLNEIIKNRKHLSGPSFLSKKSIELIEQNQGFPSELAIEILQIEEMLSSEGAFKSFQIQMRLLDKKHSGETLTRNAMWILDYTSKAGMIPSVEFWHILAPEKRSDLLKRHTSNNKI